MPDGETPRASLSPDAFKDHNWKKSAGAVFALGYRGTLVSGNLIYGTAS